MIFPLLISWDLLTKVLLKLFFICILSVFGLDGNINSSPLISAFVNTSRLSKIGSNSLLNQVIEEDENEHD